MTRSRIAIPSSLPGGLQAQVGAHFGHCDVYTMIDVEDAVKAMIKGDLERFTREFTCGGDQGHN